MHLCESVMVSVFLYIWLYLCISISPCVSVLVTLCVSLSVSLPLSLTHTLFLSVLMSDSVSLYVSIALYVSICAWVSRCICVCPCICVSPCICFSPWICVSPCICVYMSHFLYISFCLFMCLCLYPSPYVPMSLLLHLISYNGHPASPQRPTYIAGSHLFSYCWHRCSLASNTHLLCEQSNHHTIHTTIRHRPITPSTPPSVTVRVVHESLHVPSPQFKSEACTLWSSWNEVDAAAKLPRHTCE